MKSLQLLICIAILAIVSCKSEEQKESQADVSQEVLPFRNGKLWGLANEKGEILVNPQYEYINFDDDTNPHLLAVFDKGKWGVIDQKGNIVLPIRFWRVKILPNAIVVGDTPEDKSALYNLKGKLLLAAEFDIIDYIKPGNDKWRNLLLCHKQGKVGLYDIVQEKMILNPEYEIQSVSVSNSDAEVFALAKNGRLALFNLQGKQVSDFKYQEYGGGTIMSEGYAKIQDANGLWGVVDKYGKETVPCKYKAMGLSVCNQRIAFQGNNGKWGYLNVTDGEQVVKPIYDRVRDFSDGFGEVELKRKVGFVDVNGNVVVPIEYEGALNVQKGICFMKKQEDWIPIRIAENKPINNEKYAGGNFDFLTDYAIVSCKSDNLLFQGIINTKGETLIPCRSSEYGFTLYPQNAVFQEKENHFIVFSLPEGQELVKSDERPIIKKDFMIIKQKEKYLIADLRGRTISEVKAVSVIPIKDYLLVSNEQVNDETLLMIDVPGNLAAPPLEERYVPNVSKLKGLMSKDGRQFWKD